MQTKQFKIEFLLTEEFLENKKLIVEVFNSLKAPFRLKYGHMGVSSGFKVVYYYVEKNNENKEALSKVLNNLNAYCSYVDSNYNKEPEADTDFNAINLTPLLQIYKSIHKNYVCFEPDVNCFYNGCHLE